MGLKFCAAIFEAAEPFYNRIIMDRFNSNEEALDICAEFIPLVLAGPPGRQACKWCMNHKSDGRFLNRSSGWHFELEKDALIFALVWG